MIMHPRVVAADGEIDMVIQYAVKLFRRGTDNQLDMHIRNLSLKLRSSTGSDSAVSVSMESSVEIQIVPLCSPFQQRRLAPSSFSSLSTRIACCKKMLPFSVNAKPPRPR